MAFSENRHSSAPRPTVLVVVFMVAALVLCGLYSREGEEGVLHGAQNAIMSAAGPVQRVGTSVGRASSAVSDAITDTTADANTMTELREQNEALRRLVAQTEEYRQEVERLQSLLNMKSSANVEGVAARVIGRSAEAWNQTITIDVGSASGVSAGMTVMGSSGVIGQVVSCTPSTSIVRLLTDANSGVSVVIQSNREEGIVWGSLDGLLYLKSIDSSAQVQVGDILITSGLGGSYEKGLVVGTVVKIDGEQDTATRRIYVQANTSTKPIEEVIVVGAKGSSDAAQSKAASEVDAPSASPENAENS